MSAARLESALDHLHAGLEGLLSCLDARAPQEPKALDGAWLHVQRGFESVRDELTRFEGSRDGFQERVDQCLRLYAVAAGVLARQREELAAERQACAKARARLRRVSSRDAAGESCDLSA